MPGPIAGVVAVKVTAPPAQFVAGVAVAEEITGSGFTVMVMFSEFWQPAGFPSSATTV